MHVIQVRPDTRAVLLARLLADHHQPQAPRLGIAIAGGVAGDAEAAASALRDNNLSPLRRLATPMPRPGESSVRGEDITDFLCRYGHEYTVVWLGGEVTRITTALPALIAAAHGSGCRIGLDLTAIKAAHIEALSTLGADFSLYSTPHDPSGTIRGAVVRGAD